VHPSVRPQYISIRDESVYVYGLQPLPEAPPLDSAIVVAVIAPAEADFPALRDAVWGARRQAWGALNGFACWFPPDAQGRRAGAIAYASQADAAELARLRALDEQQPGLRCYVLTSAPATP
jgi:hypothetical protein